MSGKEPDCGECIPYLMPGNADVARIFLLVQGQVITVGMEGKVVGLNHLAVWKAIEMFQIQRPVETFRKIIGVFNLLSEAKK